MRLKLTRPPTISCLLRGLSHIAHGPAFIVTSTRRHYSPSAVRTHGFNPVSSVYDHDVEGDNEDERPRHREARGYYRRKTTDLAHDAVAQIALQMSLNTGLNLLAADTSRNAIFQSLQHQTDVARIDHAAKRLIDNPMYRTNMKLWSEIMQYRQRVHGDLGVVAVWDGLRARDIDLPVTGEDADTLWQTTIKVAVSSAGATGQADLFEKVLKYVTDLKSRTGTEYHAFYRSAMGEWLRKQPKQAAYWHMRLTKDVGITNVDLRGIGAEHASSAWLGLSNRARQSLKQLCYRAEQKDLYEYFVPAISRRHGAQTALPWHKMFLASGDGPSAETSKLPEVQLLFDYDCEKSLPKAHPRSEYEQDQRALRQSDLPALTRSNMSAIVGQVHGIKPREVSDSFVAKMFATRAFPVEMIINGLSLFGIDHLGPLALRELALRSESLLDCSNRLSALKAKGIGLDGSAYGQILHRLTILENSADLYKTLMASDQHPEAFDDIHTQGLLFKSFLASGRWLDAQLTLIGLTIKDKTAQSDAWNQLLRHHIIRGDLQAVANITKQMQAQNMVLEPETLWYFTRYLLPVRHRGKEPASDPTSDALGPSPLRFVTNGYMYAIDAGVHVPGWCWKELMKRHGMLRKWDELEHLVLRVASYYAAIKERQVVRRNKMLVRVNPLLNDIFTQQMRQAFVVWALRAASERRLLSEPRPRVRNIDHGDSWPLADSALDEAWNAHVTDSEQGTGSGDLSNKKRHRTLRNAKMQHSCELWARGILLLKRLNDIGVKSRLELVRKALLGRMWMLFGPAYSTKGINQDMTRHNEISLAHYIQHANEIWDGELFDLDPKLYEPQNHPRLLVALFGQHRLVDRKAKEYANVQRYARDLLAGNRPAYHRSALVRRRIWENSDLRLVKSKHDSSPEKDTPVPSAEESSISPPHQWPAAHSSSSHPQSSPPNTQEPA